MRDAYPTWYALLHEAHNWITLHPVFEIAVVVGLICLGTWWVEKKLEQASPKERNNDAD